MPDTETGLCENRQLQAIYETGRKNSGIVCKSVFAVKYPIVVVPEADSCRDGFPYGAARPSATPNQLATVETQKTPQRRKSFAEGQLLGEHAPPFDELGFEHYDLARDGLLGDPANPELRRSHRGSQVT